MKLIKYNKTCLAIRWLLIFWHFSVQRNGFSIENFILLMIGLFGEWSLELILDSVLYCFNWSILSEIDHKSIDVFNTRVLGNGNLMISDVKLQHAGIYVCRATIPGTRNFTVAMATLTVLGMFSFFLHSRESYIFTFAILSDSWLPPFLNFVLPLWRLSWSFLI